MERSEVYKIIDTERTYQDRDLLDKNWNHKGNPSVEAELLIMEEYMSKARTAWCNCSDNSEVLDVLRKVAGVAVRCFENHGVPPRK